MGQTRKVFVYRLLCKDTIDEKITQMLKVKQEVFNDYADESLAANRDSVKMKIEDITALRFKQIADEEYQKVLKDVGGAVG